MLPAGGRDVSPLRRRKGYKPFVIARKNWLFSNTAKGTKSIATIYSIIETTKANGLIVEKYLVYLLDIILKIDIDNEEDLLDIMW